MLTISDGWKVTYGGKTYENVNLNTFRFPKRVEKGEIISMDNTLPYDVGNDMILAFKLNLSYVSVYVNGRSSYSYLAGADPGKGSSLPGDAIHMVTLPENAAGAECHVLIYPGVKDAFGALPSFYLVPTEDISACYMSVDIYTSLIGFFLFMLGAVMLCTAIVMFVLRKDFRRIFALGSLAFCMGYWALEKTDAIELFSSDFSTNTQIGYLCLYLSILPFSMLVILIRGSGTKRWQKVITYTVVAMFATFFTVVYFLNMTDTVNVAQCYGLYHLQVIVGLAMLMAGTHAKDRNSDRENRILNIGVWIVSVGVIVDVTRYYLKGLIVLNCRILFTSVMPLVSVVFVMMMIYAYLVHLNDNYMQQAEEQVLKKLAYTDVLTDLHNRAWCNRRFEELARDPSSYTIVSFDVNGLKKVNDTLGHAAGDSLLKDAGRILKACFEDYGDVIRMGGDEFLVLMTGCRKRILNRCLKRMEKLEAVYSTRRRYEIQISYGAAASNENRQMSPDELYRTADSLMYQMKKELKYRRRESL